MSTSWMPPGMSEDEKDGFVRAAPNDPHMAAALAWESWSATLAAEASVASVSTGAQSVTYRGGSSPFDVAVERANWHRSRARVKAVQVGPKHGYGWVESPRDIATYESAPMPVTGRAQIVLPTGVVGPSDADNHP